MGDGSDMSAVLLTGVYGAGKSTVAAEIAGMLEERGLPYAALDLDWLGWFDNGKLEYHGAGRSVMFANLSAVVGNYRRAGVRFFVLAWAVRAGLAFGRELVRPIRSPHTLSPETVSPTARS